MQNSIEMFNFSVFDQNTFFGQIWPKKSKWSVETEIWYYDQFEYADLMVIFIFLFLTERPFLGKFSPNI